MQCINHQYVTVLYFLLILKRLSPKQLFNLRNQQFYTSFFDK